MLNGIKATDIENWNDAVSKEHTHTFNETELNKVIDGDVAKWNAAAADASAIKADYLKAADKTALEQYADQAETDAKAHADGLNTAMDTRVKALENIDHEAYKGYADQAEADAKAYADGLAGNYDASGAAATAESNAKAYADEQLTAALTWGTF